MIEINLQNLPVLLRRNQQFLGRELLTRGGQVFLVDKPSQTLLAKLGQQEELFQEINSRLMPHTLMQISANKMLCRDILMQNSISVPAGACFELSALAQIIPYAYSLDFPVVLKPNWGTQGNLVFANITSAADLYEACLYASASAGDSAKFLVEKKFIGNEYRILLFKSGQYAALRRDPASIIGDGELSIEGLVKKESERRVADESTCLCPIPLDYIVESYLKQQGLTLESIPQMGQSIQLRDNSNIYTGGFATDVTDSVHPAFISELQKIFDIFLGLPYVGIDLMTKDIAQYSTEYVVLELNTMPAIGPHHAPAAGQARNVAKWFVDLVFDT